jgi:membrane-associated protease RseP (regulator of RpoE activity)
MTCKRILFFLVSLLLTTGLALAQQPATPPAQTAPPMSGEPLGAFSLFVDGGSFLGVYAEDISSANMGGYGLREVRGVGITEVVKNSPAEKAGLRKGDVILRFDNESVTSVRKLNRLVSEAAPDHTVKLGISRSGSDQEVTVTLAKSDDVSNTVWQAMPHGDVFRTMPRGEFPQLGPLGEGQDSLVFALGNNRRIGVSTQSLTKQLADYFGVTDGKGVLVTSVAEDSPAARAGIKAGDVITAIDGEKIEGSGDLSRAINKQKDGDVTLTIVRDKSTRTIKVTPEKTQGLRPGRVIGGQRTIRAQTRDAILQGASEGRIVIPQIALPSIPAVNVTVPRIDLPVIPQIEIVIPAIPRVRVKVTTRPVII